MYRKTTALEAADTMAETLSLAILFLAVCIVAVICLGIPLVLVRAAFGGDKQGSMA
jgi:hypothetical protein